MKSKTAEDLLGRSYDGGHVLMENAERAVEIAEQEAEERIRTELTRWHDPKEPPTHENEVLVKYTCGTGGCEFYIVAYYSNGEWQAPNNTLDEYDTILGWREIHE